MFAYDIVINDKSNIKIGSYSHLGFSYHYPPEISYHYPPDTLFHFTFYLFDVLSGVPPFLKFLPDLILTNLK
jgi:hypothetical protein